MAKQKTDSDLIKFQVWQFPAAFFLTFFVLYLSAYSNLFLYSIFPFRYMIIFSTLWWFLKRELPEKELPFLKFAGIPIAICFLTNFISTALWPILPYWINKEFFGLAILLFVGFQSKILVLPFNEKLILTICVLFIGALFMFAGKEMIENPTEVFLFKVRTRSDYLLKSITLPTSLSGAIQYLAFMLLFQLKKSSLRNKGELSQETSVEVKNKSSYSSQTQTNETSPNEIIQSFENLHDLHEHQVLTDEEYTSKKNDLIENLRDIKLSEKPEDFLTKFIPMLKTGKITKAEMKKIKEIIFNKTKKDVA